MVSRAARNEYSASPASSPACPEETETQNLSTDRPLQAAEGSTSSAMRKIMAQGGPEALFQGETDEQSLGFARERRWVEGAEALGTGSGRAMAGGRGADGSGRLYHTAAMMD